MTLQEIKQAVDEGKVVHWKSDYYDIIKDNKGGYLIHCKGNNHCIGLTWTNGVTMNGKPEDFYVSLSSD